MKLVRYFNRKEGVITPQDCYIVFGKNIDTNGFNGVYLILRLFFILKKQKYFNPQTFDLEEDKCFPSILFLIRKPLGCKTLKFFTLTSWFPIWYHNANHRT